MQNTKTENSTYETRKRETIEKITETLQTINSVYSLDLILGCAKCLSKDE